MLLSKCAECNSKNSKFIKKEEASVLLTLIWVDFLGVRFEGRGELPAA